MLVDSWGSYGSPRSVHDTDLPITLTKVPLGELYALDRWENSAGGAGSPVDGDMIGFPQAASAHARRFKYEDKNQCWWTGGDVVAS